MKTEDRSQQIEADICVMGAGMVGAAVACAMADKGFKVAVVEPFMPEEYHASQAPDLRMSALNKHSIDLLQDLGAYEHILQMRYRDYDCLQVWEDEFAKTSFSASDIGESKLGIFAENRIIQLALLKCFRLQYAESIQVFPHKAKHIDIKTGTLQLDNDVSIKSALIVGADGANSQVRRSAAIGQTGWDYEQLANLILIETSERLPDTTWQQFTPSGPLACLPMHDNYACLVWYANASASAELNGANLQTLKQMIEVSFPPLLGDFSVLEHANFPLRRAHANQYWRSKAVLIGDAAHTINPLAGQGVNLGFKDVAALADALERYGLDDLKSSLTSYEKARRHQNLLMMSSMDVLYSVFSNKIGPLKLVRNIALGAAQHAGPVKNMALKYAMGI
uniref:FAD-dependent monooxygenase n=1 Tax=Ningiella ruwaisensis TaxID=2364274 RepID=UPI0010A09918|nr:FAD-dependent monooxygenase [Ningiella ruwaisensis]